MLLCSFTYSYVFTLKSDNRTTLIVDYGRSVIGTMCVSFLKISHSFFLPRPLHSPITLSYHFISSKPPLANINYQLSTINSPSLYPPSKVENHTTPHQAYIHPPPLLSTITQRHLSDMQQNPHSSSTNHSNYAIPIHKTNLASATTVRSAVKFAINPA